MVEAWAIALALLSALLGGTAPVIIKTGTAKDFSKLTNIIFNPHIILGLGLYGLGTIVFIPSLKGGSLSVLYPLIATSYIWSSIFSSKFLGEKINKFKCIGIACIIIGITLIGIGL
jgi:drug/metabolite transporter (DMT)-like permease